MAGSPLARTARVGVRAPDSESLAGACGQRGHCWGGGRAALAQPLLTKLPAVAEPSLQALAPRPGLPPPPGPRLNGLPPTQDNAPHSRLVPVATALGQLNRGDVLPSVPHCPGDPSVAPLRGGKCPGPPSTEMSPGRARQGKPSSPGEPGPGAPDAVPLPPQPHPPDIAADILGLEEMPLSPSQA